MSLNVDHRGLVRACEGSELYFTLALLGRMLSVAYVEPGEVHNHCLYDGGQTTNTDEIRDSPGRHES